MIALVVFFSFCRLFSIKLDEGIYNFKTFYELEDDTVDVLFIGSSHCYEHINTGLLYEEHGMASFILGSAAQFTPTGYYTLVEALKTQTPKLVVLEAYTLAPVRDHREESWELRNTFGFKPSLDWIKNIKAVIPDDEFWHFFFRFYRYHNRYEGDLNSKDYYSYKGMKLYEDWKGYCPNYEPAHYNTPTSPALTDTLPLEPDVEKYYRMFIELCQSQNIPLHIVVSPCFVPDDEMRRFNRAQEIAAEYSVPFVNFNTQEYLDLLNFDHAKDMAINNHINYRASARFTLLLGEMIASAYDLPDRRGESRYASWALSAAYHARDIHNQQYLREETQFVSYLDRIAKDPDYTVVISITGYCAPYYDQIIALLAPLGINNIYFSYDMNGTWAVRNGEVIKCFSSDMQHPYIQLDRHTVTFAENHIPILERTPVFLVERGLNILVYDHVTQTVADTVGFDAPRGFSAVR